MFVRLAYWCHDRRRLVLVLWAAALVLGWVSANAAGAHYRNDIDLPDVESERGRETLESEAGGAGTGNVATIVFRADRGVDDPHVTAAMSALLEEIAGLDGVRAVQSPYEVGGEQQIARTGRDAGRIAFARVELTEDVEWATTEDIRTATRSAGLEVEGLQVEPGGWILAESEQPSSETLGLAFAIIILVVAFGSVLAMGLPVGVALAGIGLGTATVALLSNVVVVPEASTFIGVMIGLGVGIDYALLIVARYREQLHQGHPVRESIGIAMDNAGRSVLFAGTTVIVSLLGMLAMGVGFVRGFSVSAAAVVAVTVAASLTLLPALLGFCGDRIEVTRWRGLIAAGLVAVALVGIALDIAPLVLGIPGAIVVLLVGLFFGPLRREVPRRPPRELRQTVAYRWSRVVQRHPWRSAISAGLFLALLAAPAFVLRLGFADESNYAEETSTRRAYDLMVDGFGPGYNGPLLLVAELPGGSEVADLDAVASAVAADPGVQAVSPVRTNDPDHPTVATWAVVPTSGPQDEATAELVQRLRTDVLPPAETATGLQVDVTGVVAVNVDFSRYLASRMPYFFLAVLALSFLLLLVVFRSLLVPLKAVIMNLLSIGAAYGIVVALFQWGWLSDVTGVQPAPIEPWAPMLLFAIVFGLSMDYEVFLLSRVREEWHRTGDPQTSVADGLAATAKVITAAAAIMVVVFGSFILETDRTAKLMGVGLAAAILLDATVVRMLLVPATMELLGRRNWWLPAWLDRLLPTIDVEGTTGRSASEQA